MARIRHIGVSHQRTGLDLMGVSMWAAGKVILTGYARVSLTGHQRKQSLTFAGGYLGLVARPVYQPSSDHKQGDK